jgi:hypothetical protein
MKLTSNRLYCCIYTCIIFFCSGSRAKRASSSSQTSRAELVLWLGCLTSRAEPARFLNEPARARSSRAELARYPPLCPNGPTRQWARDPVQSWHEHGSVRLEACPGQPGPIVVPGLGWPSGQRCRRRSDTFNW